MANKKLGITKVKGPKPMKRAPKTTLTLKGFAGQIKGVTRRDIFKKLLKELGNATFKR